MLTYSEIPAGALDMCTATDSIDDMETATAVVVVDGMQI